MPIEFIRPTVDEARRMWEQKPFKYSADLEREGKKTRLAIARYISEFQDSAICTCVCGSNEGSWLVSDPHCPVHGK